MTEEEYLKARGWSTDLYGWTHPGRTEGGDPLLFNIAEAVALQLAEDRACLAFVQNRGDASGPLFEVEHGMTRARRNGVVTVHFDDGTEVGVRVMAGDGMSATVEAVARAMFGAVRR